jgi:hypothetical protein
VRRSWAAFPPAIPARAAGVYFDDSPPDLIMLRSDHYEVGFRKANGPIARIAI